MKLSILFASIISLSLASHMDLKAQLKYETRTAKVTFQSKTPVEEFLSENNQVTSILKVEGTKKIVAFNVMMRSFKFEKALMEEHFNEKYVHSEQYPSAKFVGTIPANVDVTKPGVYKATKIDGTFTFHGVSKPITIPADIEVKANNEILAYSTFKIIPDEYNVKIPKLVDDKVSKEISVSVDALYKQSR